MWGSMSEGSQFFPGSLERNSVGRTFGIILINILQMLVYKSVGCKCLGKGCPQKPPKLFGHEQLWFHSIHAIESMPILWFEREIITKAVKELACDWSENVC